MTTGAFLGGTLVACVLATGFALFSPGRALLVTFVPGVVFAWILFASFARTGLPRPGPDALRLYALAIVVQLVHFAEELWTGFPASFPTLYGGEPFGTQLFISFNLLAYVVFAAAGTAALQGGHPVAWIPTLFFIVYGTLGNAIAHTSWAIMGKAYFPGLATAPAHAALGFALLYQVLRSSRAVIAFVVPFGTVLVTLLFVFAE